MKTFSMRQKYGWIALCFIVGIACWLAFSKLIVSTSAIGQMQVDQEVDTSIPQPGLSPADVVTLQVNSIRNAVGDLEKLKVCYSLASPENRKATGPFSRFSELVMLPPYDRLANCVDWQIGGTVVEQDFAAVLVSTISEGGDVSGFRFILQRQDFKARSCWLTEGVQNLVEESVDWQQDPEIVLDRKFE